MNKLTGYIKQFEYYKGLGYKTIASLTFEELQKEFVKDTNSVAIIVKHLSGNMLSRWTNFLTEDGEKKWRHRDLEFIDSFTSKDELLNSWNNGWNCLFDALNSISDNDLDRIIYIRNEGHTIEEAIKRQLAHYSYHVGQMVFLGKLIKGKHWQSLSIPKGESAQYNAKKFLGTKGTHRFKDKP
tara:strand:+ start:14974 stop:15522 length:549 start_codon:yes stop_codon:yes gene_type:complete